MMRISRRMLITWLAGAAILTLTMFACAWFYNHEKIKVVFVIFVLVCSPLAFLNKYFGFLFLPVLVGSFYFMGNYDTWFWEKKSLEHYENFKVEDISNPGKIPFLARLYFNKNVKPDFSRLLKIEEFDNMKKDGTGHGMHLSDYYYSPLQDESQAGEKFIFLCRIEVQDASPSFETQKMRIIQDEDAQATTISSIWLDSLAIRKLKLKYNIEANEIVVPIRWGNPESFYAASWKRVWKTFLFSHLAWMILCLLHFYEPPRSE